MTLMMGRTHSVHAEPSTFGLKVAGWAFELDRGGADLPIAIDDVATGKISGRSGPTATLHRISKPRSSPRSGSTPDPVSTQIVQRDRHAALLTAIAVLGGSLEALRHEIRNLQHTEIGEVQEPFRSGQKGLVGDAAQAQSDPVRADRRPSPGSCAGTPRPPREPAAVARARHQPQLGERVVLPDSTTAPRLHARSMTGLIEGLAVRSERMREETSNAGWACTPLACPERARRGRRSSAR
jgi:adenylosuccinate lyase